MSRYKWLQYKWLQYKWYEPKYKRLEWIHERNTNINSKIKYLKKLYLVPTTSEIRKQRISSDIKYMKTYRALSGKTST